MNTIRRSERLAAKSSVIDKKNYEEIIKKMVLISRPLRENLHQLCRFHKIDIIMDILKLVNKNFNLIMKYGFNTSTTKSSIIRFLRMMYDKSFIWINQVQEIGDEKLTNMLIKEYTKYRKQYENTRYANWKFIKDLYGLDQNLMKIIDSYM